MDFSHTDFYFQTTQAEKPSKGTKTCTMVGVVIFLTLLFTIGFCIGYFGHAPQREEDLDRQILRQIYANQKLHLFGKDELQMKLFAEEIIELIGKF